ncbi:competence protein ComK [Alteribacillus sp. HJP-4]|uniref:competence protein ComK n=1 Tax=Alteribacillus sp. HJP-4 TaxID=2775394 RepID=UPI0035CD1726
MNSKVEERYFVSEKTMAFVPVFEETAQTLVYELGGRVVFTSMTPREIMSYACMERGSTMQGRHDAVKKRLGFKQKWPVPVDRLEDIYAFPLQSIRNPQNIWLFYHHVRDVKVHTKNSAYIFFMDGQQLKVPVSYYTVQQQLLRTAHCQSVFQRYKTF